MTGVVNANLELIIRTRVRGPGGQEQEIEAIIDTGFDGSLTLPPSMVSALGLPWRQRGRAVLADGRDTVFDVHEAIIIWDGIGRRVPVAVADATPLLGVSLLYGYELAAQVVVGGPVTLTRIALQ